MRKELLLITLGLAIVVTGEFLIFYEEPRAMWKVSGTTELGFEYEKWIPEMGYPLREFGIGVFVLGVVMFVLGVVLSMNKGEQK